MNEIHGTILHTMAVVIDEYGIDFGAFSRERGYLDFKLDLRDLDEAKEIAALALSALCVGSSPQCGQMDMAVVHATLIFLEETCGARGSIQEHANVILRALPVSVAQARRLISKWW
jgi:hypothetical protein